MRRIWKWPLALLAAVFLFAFSFPALAADWAGDYLTLLQKENGQRQAVALCDLSGDEDPELIAFRFQGGNPTEIRAHSSGGSFVTFDLRPLALSDVRAIVMQARRNAAGVKCLLVGLVAKQGGRAVALQMAFTNPDGKGLEPVYTAARHVIGRRVAYSVNGELTSASLYARHQKMFSAAYRAVGTLPLVLTLNTDNDAVIRYRYTLLAQAYARFSTVRGIRLSRAAVSLYAGGAFRLSAAISPATAISDTISWHSSDESLAQVDRFGAVTARKAGRVAIYARSASGRVGGCIVTIKAPPAASVAIETETLTLNKGESYQMAGKVIPAAANQTLLWYSSNPQVVGVVQATGEARALNRGRCHLYARTPNGKMASRLLVVNDGPAVIVDISQHNGARMDWARVARSVDLLILRCGVTRTETAPIGVGKDALFASYAKKCREYGIPFGVYYYGKCSDEETAVREAQMTWAVASPYNPLFYVYDAEESCLNKQRIETYMTTLKKLGARKTGYYIGHHLYTKYQLDRSLVDFIWIPHYGQNTGEVNSTPSFACDLHQYTSVGQVDGFPGRVDINRLMGTKPLSWFLR